MSTLITISIFLLIMIFGRYGKSVDKNYVEFKSPKGEIDIKKLNKELNKNKRK